MKKLFLCFGVATAVGLGLLLGTLLYPVAPDSIVGGVISAVAILSYTFWDLVGFVLIEKKREKG